jgi:enoyl-CoA hydratase
MTTSIHRVEGVAVPSSALAFTRVEVEDGVATVTLARPPVNALSAPMMRELAGVFDELGRSRDAHVAILTADGDRIFCAGADIGESERRYVRRELLPDESVADLADPGAVVRQLFWGVRHGQLPVIAAVNGLALGAGAALVACCDVIIAADTAAFSLPEIDVGVLGGARHLQRLVGAWKTREMMLTGERVPAAELYRLGAVSQVVPSAELAGTARALAGKIATKSPLAVRMAKQSMNRVEHLSLEEGYQLEQDYTSRITPLADSKEARAAWQDKRAPQWSWS